MTGAVLLVVSLTAMVVVATALLAVTVDARVRRTRRERRIAAVQQNWRMLVLEIASGEDEDRTAWRAVADLPHEDWVRLRPVVVALLGKVRGRPVEELADLLAAHGDLDRARRRLTGRSAARRAAAAHTLGLARDARSVPALIEALADPSPEVRLVAARSLGRIGDPAAGQRVLAAAGRREGAHTSAPGLPAWVVAEALLGLGPEAQEFVTAGMASPDAHVRAVAAQVALHASLGATLDTARAVVHFEHDPGIQETLLTLIGTLGGPRDVPVLAAYAHPLAPARLRRVAAEALGSIATEDALDVLAGLLTDGDRSVATVAGDMLAAAGPAGRARLSAAQGSGGGARRIAAGALHLARLREAGGTAA